MALKYTRLRVRRRLRSRQKQVVNISQTANKQLDRHIFRRWHNFKYALRFAFGWSGLIIILIVVLAIQTSMLGRFYLVNKPVSGGVYSEGLVGSFSNANPIYSTSDIDTSVSKLIFSSLLTYDNKNQLVGDLASSWQVSDSGKVYTVVLKTDIYWHDGQPLNSDDVVFTYKTMQTPDAKSPFISSWQGVTVEKAGNRTVKFTLPNVYAPFPHSLVKGIIPAHILKDIPAAQLRSAAFNNKTPVGTGPFIWKSVSSSGSGQSQSEVIQLLANDKYYQGRPKLDGVAIKTYSNKELLLEALKNKEITSASGLDMADKDIDSKYESLRLNVTGATMIFLKTTSAQLADINVRQALAKATNTKELLGKVGYPVIPVNEPILISQFGYNRTYEQITFDQAAAEKQLDTTGWIKAAGENFRKKNGQELIINLAYENKRDFSTIGVEIQKQWAAVGVNVIIDVNDDISNSQRYINSHEYDALLHAISIGPDPDVYVYWHSSQISKDSTRLNLSEYKSTVTDLALTTARSRLDVSLRAAKYIPFLEAWKRDVPAIGLYQPRYLTISNQHVYGMKEKLINTSSDRYNSIHTWMINTKKTSS